LGRVKRSLKRAQQASWPGKATGGFCEKCHVQSVSGPRKARVQGGKLGRISHLVSWGKSVPGKTLTVGRKKKKTNKKGGEGPRTDT